MNYLELVWGGGKIAPLYKITDICDFRDSSCCYQDTMKYAIEVIVAYCEVRQLWKN